MACFVGHGCAGAVVGDDMTMGLAISDRCTDLIEGIAGKHVG